MSKVALSDVEPQRRRGGELRLVFGPASGCAGGLFGALTLGPGESFREHYHPYSSESLFVSAGEVLVHLAGEPVVLAEHEAVHIPINVRHRVTNNSDRPALVVFSLIGLAPRPELGHVDTEDDASAQGDPGEVHSATAGP